VSIITHVIYEYKSSHNIDNPANAFWIRFMCLYNDYKLQDQQKVQRFPDSRHKQIAAIWYVFIHVFQ